MNRSVASFAYLPAARYPLLPYGTIWSHKKCPDRDFLTATRSKLRFRPKCCDSRTPENTHYRPCDPKSSEKGPFLRFCDLSCSCGGAGIPLVLHLKKKKKKKKKETETTHTQGVPYMGPTYFDVGEFISAVSLPKICRERGENAA